MSEDTKIESRSAGVKTIVDIDSQNVDFRNCEQIKSAVATLVGKGQSQIVLNLAHVGFMDSSGLGVILFSKRTCDEAGGSFAMCGLQSYVNNLVTLTNLNKTVKIFPSETEATSKN
jgi:anti-sigma B factor antagonist